MKKITLILNIIFLLFLLAPAAIAGSQCDNCPLREACLEGGDTSENALCDESDPFKETLATTEAAIGQSGATAFSTSETPVKDIIKNISTSEIVATTSSTFETSFMSLNAFGYSDSKNYVIKITGEAALRKKLSEEIIKKFGLYELKSAECELTAETAELSLKIKTGAEKEKIDFIESLKIKIYK